ncbi:MAG: ectoine/hydroxyectoine ABC transporter substrate-binding protein EhuB [Pseudomonadota bacterium]|nr:ectoine/hydroxyectoine ABC transporter substrate-binding protein EhuB [Pseudomonadota bacterium]
MNRLARGTRAVWWLTSRRIASLFFFATLPLLTGCGDAAPTGSTHSSTLERLRETGVARVGFANEAPFAYLDESSGRLTGEAPEIARVLLRELGVTELEGVLTEFGSLIPGLKAGRFDLIAAGMYILPPRCREIAFSNPTYRIGEAFLVAAGNPRNLHSYADVAAQDDTRLGVVAGAVQLNHARALGVPMRRVAILPDPPSAVAALRGGRIDAYAATALTVEDMLRKSGGGLERAVPFTAPRIDGKSVVGYGAFGLRQEDTALRAALNRELADFIGTDRHLQAVEPFGFTRQELPGPVTADDLCRP